LYILNPYKVLAIGPLLGPDLYKVSFTIQNSNIMTLTNTELWHKRLGHLSYPNLQKLITNKNLHVQNKSICENCIYSKQTRKPLADKKPEKISNPLDIVYSDVCGPFSPLTRNKEKYFVTFIEAYTHFTFVYLIKNKSDVFLCFKEFLVRITNLLNGTTIKYLYCDNGGEYTSLDFQNFCKTNGIEMHFTIRDTPALNGVAERMNRTLLERTRALLFESGVPKSFWGYALLTAVYLINRSPTSALKENKTPYEKLKGTKPDLSNLKIFGCVAYAKLVKNSKLEKCSDKCIHLGYVHNGYKLLNLNNFRIITVRDVIFDENTFYKDLKIKTTFDNEEESNNLTVQISGKPNLSNPQTTTEIAPLTEKVKTRLQTGTEISAPGWLKDFEVGLLKEENINFMVNFVCDIKIPSCYSDIQIDKNKFNWIKAVQEELTNLKNNNTWSLVDRPVNKNIIGCKWIFRVKMDKEGNAERFKARLVAKGYKQQPTIDYTETFAPVARMTSFRIIIALCVQYDLILEQLDVKSAFLHSSLNEEIYMEVPEGIQCEGDKVCKLKKTIYGLKQAPRYWNNHLDNYLKGLGFTNSKSDYCIYIKNNGSFEENIYILLYVDDLLIACKNPYTLKNLKENLSKIFTLTELGLLNHYLGISITRDNDKIYLSQKPYLEKILKKPLIWPLVIPFLHQWKQKLIWKN